MPDTFTLPSPADAVAAAIEKSGTGESDTNPLAGILKKTEAQPEIKPETAKPEIKADPEKATEKPGTKSLADSIVSDEAPAPEAKKTEAPADEPREGEKPAAFIKRLKQERADALAQVEQLKTKVGQRTEAAPDEIAALRAEIAERDALLESAAFEKSRKYQEQFTKPLDKATAAAKDLIGKLTDTKGVFERGMALEPKERLEFLKEHLGDGAATVFDRMSRIDEISSDRDAALKDRTEINKAIEAEREKSEGAEILKAFDGQRESIAKKLSDYRGADADALAAQARTLITGEAPAADVIAAAYLAPLVPRLIERIKSKDAELATLRARIAEDAGDKPAINGRGTDTSDASKGYVKDGRVLPMSDVLKSQGLRSA